jgi:hypothetical protein
MYIYIYMYVYIYNICIYIYVYLYSRIGSGLPEAFIRPKKILNYDASIQNYDGTLYLKTNSICVRCQVPCNSLRVIDRMRQPKHTTNWTSEIRTFQNVKTAE